MNPNYQDFNKTRNRIFHKKGEIKYKNTKIIKEKSTSKNYTIIDNINDLKSNKNITRTIKEDIENE
jgi:hypothetical protein